MPYDKYRNWPLPTRAGNLFQVPTGTQIEQVVLTDLAQAEDDADKLEILDSYAAYAKRDYQQEVAQAIAALASRIFRVILEPNVLSRLPSVEPVHRGRMAQKQ